MKIKICSDDLALKRTLWLAQHVSLCERAVGRFVDLHMKEICAITHFQLLLDSNSKIPARPFRAASTDRTDLTALSYKVARRRTEWRRLFNSHIA